MHRPPLTHASTRSRTTISTEVSDSTSASAIAIAIDVASGNHATPQGSNGSSIPIVSTHYNAGVSNPRIEQRGVSHPRSLSAAGVAVEVAICEERLWRKVDVDFFDGLRVAVCGAGFGGVYGLKEVRRVD